MPAYSPLVRLNPKDVVTLSETFSRENHPYFPDNNLLRVPFKQLLGVPDTTVGLFRWSYPGFCFEKSVLERGGFTAGRPLLEAASGNNDISRLDASLLSFPQGESDRAYISNYSGGRGDYFTLEKLVKIFNARHARLRLRGSLKLENFCVALGAQGALHAAARYFAKTYPGQKLAILDSAYVGTYTPFVAESVPVEKIPTSTDCTTPSVEEIFSTIRRPDVFGLMCTPYHNPTGDLWSEDVLTKVCTELARLNKYLVCSEVFDGLDWGSAVSASETVARACSNSDLSKFVRVFSVSKSRALAGFRAGYMVSTEELAFYASQLNALSAFNTPVTNSKMLVLHEYLTELSRGGSAQADIESFLGISPNHAKELVKAFVVERAETIGIIRENFCMALELMDIPSPEIAKSNRVVRGNGFTVIVPRGGINCLVKVDALQDYDQIDLFRKVYLWSGLIMQSSQYFHAKPETWIRLTLSHSAEKVADVVRVVRELPSIASALKLSTARTAVELY